MTAAFFPGGADTEVEAHDFDGQETGRIYFGGRSNLGGKAIPFAAITIKVGDISKSAFIDGEKELKELRDVLDHVLRPFDNPHTHITELRG